MNRAELEAISKEALERTEKLEKDLRVMQGKLKNVDPAQQQTLEAEIKHLKERREKLLQAIRGMIGVELLARSPEEDKVLAASLKEALVAFAKKENLPADLWKDLAS